MRQDVAGGTAELLILASDVQLGSDPLPAAEFAFVAPAGAKKLERPKESEITHAMVAPIFRARCTGCHGAGDSRGGLDLSTYASTMKGGRSGAIITPGKPEDSSLVHYLTGQKQPRMPIGGGSLSSAQIDTIRGWIKGGAREK